MEPILPEPTAPNSVPQNKELYSVQPTNVPQGSEVAPNTAPEQSHEAITQVVSPVQATVMPTQSVVDSTSNTATAVPVQGSAQADDPLIADDVDVIEKEWVDKAKKIVNATKEDPFQQEKEVSKLQADYLMKRYNKQLKLPE